MNAEEIANVHRTFGPALFNKTWEYLTKPSLTADEQEEMIHIAHASRYHWSDIGKPVNFARGEWLLARVYSTAQRPTEALYWAQRCRNRCEENTLSTFDCAASAEAVARAYAVGQDFISAAKWRQTAAETGSQIEDAEDKKIFDEDLASLDELLAQA